MNRRYSAKKYQNQVSTALGESTEKMSLYEDLIDLSIGDPDVTTPEVIIEGAYRDALAGHTHYTDTLGDMELREEIASFYQEEYGLIIPTAGCMITTSACHAMWLVLESVLDPMDEVIIHEPYFTPYKDQILMAGGVPVHLITEESEGFQITPEKLRKALSPRTRAIILNTPNNPTGACFTKETLQLLADSAKEKDLLIISDDVYTSFSYEEPFSPMLGFEGMEEHTITIGSFSKDFAMAGWRIGYVLAPEELIQTMKRVNENNVYTAPSISQRAALHALRNRKDISSQLVPLYRERILYAYDRVMSLSGMTCLKPGGGIYLFVNIKDTGLSAEDVSERLLHEAHVLTIPGTAFGDSGEGYLRLAMTVDLKTLETAFDRISSMDLFKTKEERLAL